MKSWNCLGRMCACMCVCVCVYLCYIYLLYKVLIEFIFKNHATDFFVCSTYPFYKTALMRCNSHDMKLTILSIQFSSF